MRSIPRGVTRRRIGGMLLIGVLAAGPGAAAEPAAPQATTPLEQIAPTSPPIRPTASQPASAPADVSEAVQNARELLRGGQARKTLEMLRPLVDAHPDHYDAQLLLARAWAAVRRFDKAIEAARRAATLRPDEPEPRVVLGDLLRLVEQPQRAIGQYRAATLAPPARQDQPAVTLAWQRLGDVLADEGYLLAAAEAFGEFDRRVFDQYPEHRDDGRIANLVAHRPRGMLIRRLELLTRVGRADRRLAAAQEAARRWPDDPQVQGELGWALIAAGRPDEALELTRGYADRPEQAYIFRPIALRALSATGALDAWLEKQIAAGPSAMTLLAARQLLLDDRSDAALRLLDALADAQPDDVLVAQLRFDAALRAGKPAEALERLADFVNANRSLPWLPVEDFVERLRQGRERAALIHLAEAMDDPHDFGRRFAAAIVELAAGRDEPAARRLQALAEAARDFAPARTAAAQVALLDGDWDRARALARALLDTQDTSAAHWLLGRALSGLDRNDEAEKHLRKAATDGKRVAAYALDLARHEARTDNARGAQRFYQQALAAEPRLGEALEELIDSYLRDGKLELARAALERADVQRVAWDAQRRARLRLRYLRPPFSDDHLAALSLQSRRFPRDRGVARLRAMALYFRQRYAEVLECLDALRPLRAAERYPLGMLRANALVQRADFDRAFEQFDALCRRHPNRREVLHGLARMAMATLRVETARQVLDRLIELARRAGDEDQLAAARSMALQTWLLLGQQDAALARLETWRRQDPQDEWVRDRWLETLAQMRKADDLREPLRAALAAATDDERRAALASLAIRAGLYDLAETSLHAWLDGAGEVQRRIWMSMLVDLLIRAGRAAEAIELAERYEGGFQDGVLRRLWAARARVAAGQIDRALSDFDALLHDRLVPQELRPTIRQQSIAALADAGKVQRALERCRAWLEATDDPEQRQAAWGRIVSLHIEQGRVEDAVRAARAWLDELETADPKYRFAALRAYGAALQAAGREQEYAATLVEARNYRPDDVGMANDLGYTWIDHGQNPERAAELIRRAVAAEPLNAAFIDSLGWLYYRTGRFEQAFTQLSRAVQLVEGRDPVVYDHLADCAWRLGRADTARDAWQKALKRIEDEKDPIRLRAYRPVEQRIRAKLDALSARRDPAVAPTLEEQHGTQAARVRD